MAVCPFGGTRYVRHAVGSSARAFGWERLVKLRRLRRLRNAATLALVVLGPALAIGTYLTLGPFGQGANSPALRAILLADIVYVLIVAALVLWQVGKLVAARRRKSAGSRLHLRLTGVFALIAAVPTVLVAVFAGLTINLGLESWFSDRVREVVGASLEAAQAYKAEHRHDLEQDAAVLAGYLNVARAARGAVSDGQIRQVLGQGQAQVQRGLREAYVIDGGGDLRARGERSYLFDFEKPTEAQMEAARAGETVIIEDWENSEFRALLRLSAFPDRFLYVSREVDGQLLGLLDDTEETVTVYNQLEQERGRRLFEFGVIYLGFAAILILASIWLGLWFAERLSRPVGRLTGAAQRVGEGDLDVRVIEDSGDDEIAMLGRIFNQMTRQLKGQRTRLLDNSARIEERRRLFEQVLSSVTAGVIGLDPNGQVEFMNRSAHALLDLGDASEPHIAVGQAVPEFAGLLERLRTGEKEVAREEIKISRKGKLETLLVRMARRRGEEGEIEGYVVAFDDVSELVTAQRMAAWGDVARRIAHEIKNPLTPIQLSAERIRRKFTPMVGEEAESLDQLTGVIVRQTGDLRRIVDEFSKFARMPEPDRKPVNLAKVLRDAVLLQRESLGDGLQYEDETGGVMADLDETMVSQALINLIKNAGEAIESLQEKGAPEGHVPNVRVRLYTDAGEAVVEVADNGIGLPEDRGRLFEPYVTTREKGTGLGLPIVKKIIEEHGGSLELTDAEPFTEGAHRGALAVVRLPRSAEISAAAE
ncbi:PAS domain-containing sensor histidine kinase [Oceanicola sp. D3]|uniref:sensor histidine kinase NtrY-like n=1 Tax=Oceanicola sp. D3 TaxID=2587163 RepID=UPI00112386B2|nr:PAS domain-containing sensor histidine kinase [Oceanicola sp. D3]QDC09698.1 PAS domain-containing sensor histidine kinase [Oceanicola sp. D3]